MGVPGKIVRQLDADDRKLIELTAEHYRALGRYYREKLALDERSRLL
jgi:hypothetical protein